MQTKTRGPYAKTPARRATIVAAAREAFIEHGYDDASLREIAKRAGITHQGLLRHFSGKPELLLEVLRQRDITARARADELAAAGASGRRGDQPHPARRAARPRDAPALGDARTGGSTTGPSRPRVLRRAPAPLESAHGPRPARGRPRGSPRARTRRRHRRHAAPRRPRRPPTPSATRPRSRHRPRRARPLHRPPARRPRRPHRRRLSRLTPSRTSAARPRHHPSEPAALTTAPSTRDSAGNAGRAIAMDD